MLAIRDVSYRIPRQWPVRNDAHIAMRLAAVRHRPEQRLGIVRIDVFIDADDDFVNHSRRQKRFQSTPSVVRLFFLELNDRHLSIEQIFIKRHSQRLDADFFIQMVEREGFVGGLLDLARFARRELADHGNINGISLVRDTGNFENAV